LASEFPSSSFNLSFQEKVPTLNVHRLKKANPLGSLEARKLEAMKLLSLQASQLASLPANGLTPETSNLSLG
jgi:hypothetical protein